MAGKKSTDFGFFDLIKQRPWNSRYFKLPHWHKKYPTMLTHEEMRLLAWLAQNSHVDGEIVDLGCFLGGSSVSLAWGVKQSQITRQVYSYDKFEIDEKLKQIFLYKRGHQYFGGQNALQIFTKFTEEFSDIIHPVAGDVTSEQWNKGKISILFIDLSKSTVLNDYIIEEFFPYLSEGSLIIQQDFLFYRNPWLYSTMHKLADSIELLSYADDYSVVFGMYRVPSKDELIACLSENTTPDDTIEAIKYFREKFNNVRQLEMIDALLASYESNPEIDKSWQFKNIHNIPISFDLD